MGELGYGAGADRALVARGEHRRDDQEVQPSPPASGCNDYSDSYSGSYC